MKRYLDPTYDTGFKLLFGREIPVSSHIAKMIKPLYAILLAVVTTFMAKGAVEITLDSEIPANLPSEGIYNNAPDALAALNGCRSGILYVRPGVYWLDDPDSPVTVMPKAGSTVPFAVEVTCDTLSIIGTDTDAEATVFAVNRGQTQGAIGNFTMMHFIGRELKVENMSFGNYCNVDLNYRRNPELSRAKRNASIVQAQIGICELSDRSGKWSDYGSGTEKVEARNCRFISRLNLCPFIGARESYYTDCYFECTDDALTGTAVYRNCSFTFFSSKPFYSTAPTGAVFINCDITLLTHGVQYLTKIPGMVTLIDTRFHTPGGKGDIDIRWTRDPSAVVCYQRGVTLDGRPVNIDADRKKLWQPLDSRIHAGTLLRLSPAPISLKAAGDTAVLDPEIIEWGGRISDQQPEIVGWNFPDFVKLEGNRLISANLFPEPMEGVVYATTSDGLRGGVAVKVEPLLADAPTFIEMPSITSDKKGKTLTVNYQLDSDNPDDRSTITWLRGTSPTDKSAIPVLRGPVSRAGSYHIGRADKGTYIFARVEPQVYGSCKGEPAEAVYEKEISMRHTATLSGDRKSYYTDFLMVPTENSSGVTLDGWTFDAFKPADTSGYDWEADYTRDAWFYGKGVDGAAEAEGLVENVRGARAFFNPDRSSCKETTLKYLLYPAKPAGQGFGSATGQYMDFYFMFDPQTMTGYALRVERTPDHDRAVECRLQKVDHGMATPISEPSATTSFRSPCHLEISAGDGQATARLYSGATDSGITLTAPISVGKHPAAFGIQHTGSVGGGATLIKTVEAEWK